MVNEIVRLSAHEKFIIDGITRQAGTVEKAVLELVMNAIEAQICNDKDPVVISFTVGKDGQGAKLVVRDLGRGFKTRNEIEQWFAKFGTPHDECPECKRTMALNGNNFVCSCGYKTEGRTWAEFRMGRGQAFSFGRNVWRTGEFCMEYDLRTPPGERSYAHGTTCPKCTNNSLSIVGDDYQCSCGYTHCRDHILDFSLQSGLPFHPGCEVTVYFYKNPIGNGYRSIEAFKYAIKHHVEFMSGKITFNDEIINIPANTLNWDIETDDAYFMFGKGNKLSLYNIGAFVKDYSAADMGVTGVVVSKSKLAINFARNDVMQNCPIWKRIQVIIRENKIKKVRRVRRRLNDDERTSTLLDLRYGDADYGEVKNIGLIRLTNGKVMSLEMIKKIRSLWTFASPGDRVADHLMQVGMSICFSRDMLDILGYSGEPKYFFNWLLRWQFDEFDRTGKLESSFSKIVPFYDSFNKLSGSISNVHRIIPSTKLSKSELRFLRVMEGLNCWNGRSLCIGLSETADGWTDGHSYIAFNREYLKRWNPQYYRGAAALVTLAFHELAHDEDDRGSHVHAIEFYQNYHDLTKNGSLSIIGELPHKMRLVKWQDHAAEVAEKETKKKEQRDIKLGIKRVKSGKAGCSNRVKNNCSTKTF